MAATILDGREIAAAIVTSIKTRVDLLAAAGVKPALFFVSIGTDTPALMYLSRLQKLAGRAGILVERVELPTDVSLPDLDATVARLNADSQVDGILVQMPLPSYLTPVDLSVIVEPRKDVDGLTVQNAGRLYLGMRGQVPSTALAMKCILDVAQVDLIGAHVVVVGRSNVVGHPVAELLLQADATVTVAHRATRNLGNITREADVLLMGAGAPHLIGPDMIKPGVVIVDAGINPVPAGIVGDVDFERCQQKAAAITPVPGGVGPVTNAIILRNLVDSAEQRTA